MAKDIDLDALQALAPCPFCGSSDIHFPPDAPTYCNQCEATALNVAAWNRRADTSAETDIRDAARYRWLRERTWDRDVMCVVAYPKAAVRLGTDCPSTSRLDAAIDSAISAGRMDDGTQVKETAIPLTTADAKEREDHIEAERGMVGEQATCRVDYLRANFTPFYLLANARRIASAEYRRKPNWVLAMDLFAVGSNSAHAICREAGIDPDAYEVRRAGGKEGAA